MDFAILNDMDNNPNMFNANKDNNNMTNDDQFYDSFPDFEMESDMNLREQNRISFYIHAPRETFVTTTSTLQWVEKTMMTSGISP